MWNQYAAKAIRELDNVINPTFAFIASASKCHINIKELTVDVAVRCIAVKNDPCSIFVLRLSRAHNFAINLLIIVCCSKIRIKNKASAEK